MGKKLTELTAATLVAADDLVGIVTNPSTSPVSKSAAISTLFLKRNLIDNDSWAAKGDIVAGTGADNAMIVSAGTKGQILAADSTQTAGLKWVDNSFGLNVVIGNAADVISTGLKLYVEMPFAGTIQAVRLFADVSGSIAIDLWRDSYNNFPPTIADSMPGSAAHPAIASAQKSQTISFSGWSTVNFSKGDVIGINVDSCTTIKQCTISLTGIKTV